MIPLDQPQVIKYPIQIGEIFSVSDSLLWIVFSLAMIVFLVFTWILTYHWKNFDIGSSLFVLQAKIVYFIGSTVLIAVMALIILYG